MSPLPQKIEKLKNILNTFHNKIFYYFYVIYSFTWLYFVIKIYFFRCTLHILVSYISNIQVNTAALCDYFINLENSMLLINKKKRIFYSCVLSTYFFSKINLISCLNSFHISFKCLILIYILLFIFISKQILYFGNKIIFDKFRYKRLF